MSRRGGAGKWTRNPIQQVPTELAATLRSLRKECFGSKTNKRYHLAMRVANERGWSVAALAVAVESSAMAVAQLIHRAQAYVGKHSLADVVIPCAPPAGPHGPNVPVVDLLKVVPAERVQRMRKLQKLARQVTCGTPADHPHRVASRELAAELYDLMYVQGFPAERVARDLLRVTGGAVANRLRANGLPHTRALYEQQESKKRRANHRLAA
jgi:hypothetical protein